VGRAGGEHAHGLVAAQAWRAHFQAWLVFQGLVKQEQQPDMADLLQALHRIALVERRHQLQHARAAGASCGWRGMANFSLKQERTKPTGETV
jgi:hypothetical protein